MSREKFCSYFEGMFTQEPWDSPPELNIFAHLMEKEATQFHEAGHAVIQYVLGLGIYNIELSITKTIEEENEMYSYHSKSTPSNSASTRLVRRLNKGDFCSEVLAQGMAAAAGPAAERKYYLTRAAPIRTLMASEGDHDLIDRSAKKLSLQGRNGFAYQRLVWRRAQLALEAAAALFRKQRLVPTANPRANSKEGHDKSHHKQIRVQNRHAGLPALISIRHVI